MTISLFAVVHSHVTSPTVLQAERSPQPGTTLMPTVFAGMAAVKRCINLATCASNY